MARSALNVGQHGADWRTLSADEKHDVLVGLRNDVDVLKIINTFAIDLINITDRVELAWYIAREVVGKLGFADCVVYLMNSDGDTLVQTAAIGEEKNPIKNEIVNALRIPVGSGITGDVARTRTPAIVDNLAEDARYIPDIEPAQSEICVPLFIDTDVVGVIDCESSELAAFDDFHLEILTTVAAIASAKFKNLQYDLDREAAKRLADLVAVVDAISEPLAIFDDEDRFVFTNEAYHRLNEASPETVAPGVNFEKHIRSMVSKGAIADAVGCETDWIANRMELHRREKAAFELRGAGAKWLLALEERLPSGGQVLILTDITELKAAQTRAEKASLAKTAFLSSMSHELRTPMNAILGFAQVLERTGKAVLSPNQRQCIEQILSSGNHMLRLIEDTLELNNIEAGQIKVVMSDTTLRSPIEESIRLVRSRADSEGIQIIDECDGMLDHQVWTDATRLKQILVNLMTNAIKYNTPDGTVTIKVERRPGQVIRVSVADTGIGMTVEQQRDVFAPYNRLGHETSGIEGTGIGLTIADQLARLMDMELGFVSEEGLGSTFWIEVPLCKRGEPKS